jgi:hypothetical protein
MFNTKPEPVDALGALLVHGCEKEGFAELLKL